MERLACYQAHKAGVELSARRVIEVLSEAKMSILEQDKTKTTLYWRQGVSANAQKNNTYADELDALFRVAGLEPPSCISSAWS